MRSAAASLGAVLLAVLLTIVFFSPLWSGGGLIGGDLYTYYMPQKMVFSEALHAGTIPLWNNVVGHGYPIVAESQTGVFYPFNLLLYRLLDVNTAYNVNLLIHYVLAFCGMLLYARRMRLGWAGGLLAALVYTYGWFPVRIILEWAIIGGAWLPFALWGAESFIQTGRWRYLAVLLASLTLQILPGHFHIAFMTQLLLIIYIPCRLWMFDRQASPVPLPLEDASTSTANEPPLPVAGTAVTQRDRPRQSRPAPPATGSAPTLQPVPQTTPQPTPAVLTSKVRTGLLVLATWLCLYPLAALQLFPTWELKKSSQRRTVGGEHNPQMGFIPTAYLTQVFLPWDWYDSPHELNKLSPEGSPITNRVEAHLYFGQLPFYLAILALCLRKPRDSRKWLWGLPALFALLYATRTFGTLPNSLPGFNFFNGPGRYGILTTWGVAMFAGLGLERCLAAIRWRVGKLTVATLVLLLTTADLWLVSEHIAYAEGGAGGYASITPSPILKVLSNSNVRELLAETPTPKRLFCRGANIPSLLGIASTPVYLGIGPAAYYDPQLTIPEPLPFDIDPTRAQLDWLGKAGVTHILSFERLDTVAWNSSLVWYGDDRFLNRVWGRYGGGEELPKFFLYRLKKTRGRVSWIEKDESGSRPAPEVTALTGDRVEIHTAAAQAGTLLLTDLAYPGWHVEIDGAPAKAETVDGMYRGVHVPAGPHTVVWRYQPASLFWGVVLSAATLLLLLAVAHVRYWHPRWLDRWLPG